MTAGPSVGRLSASPGPRHAGNMSTNPSLSYT
jgi:hypothetical protein